MKRGISLNKEIKNLIENINKGIIPDGYKKTKIGIVPVEWEEVSFSKLFLILKNNTFSRAELNCEQGDYLNIHYGDILTRYGTILYCDKEKIPYINQEIEVKTDCLIDGDIIITDTAEDQSVGRLIEIRNIKKRKIVSGLHTIPCRPQKQFASKWLGYYMDSFAFHNQLIPMITGIKVSSISKAEIKKTFLVFPPIPEQQKIVEILSTQDKLIELQKRKIEQLKTLKKGYLQKMFPKKGSSVPEIRFKGFSDAWKQRKLGDLADIVGGGTPSTSNDDYWDGDIDWYAPAEIADQIFVSSSERKITQQGYDNSSAKMLPVGTVLFTSRAGIGKTAILRKKGCTNQGFQSIVPHENELDSYFIFSRTEELKRYGESVGAGSTFVEVSGKQMANMGLMMPKEIEEQQQIGFFFQHLDTLITLNQRKLDEEKQKKKALMQLLLTGKVRVKHE